MMKNKEIYRSEEGKQKIMAYYEILLQNIPEHAEQKTINGSWGDTFVILCGNPKNSPLILLHGTSSNSAMWMNELHNFSKTNFVVAVDIVGECGKSAERRPKFKKGHYARWLDEVIDTLGLQKISMIGYSLGGWIALDYAIHFPKKVEKLLLFASGGLVPVKIRSILWIMVTSLLGKVGFNQLNKMVYKNIDLDKTTLQFADLIRQYFIPRPDIIPLFKEEEINKIICSLYYFGGQLDCFYASEKAARRLKIASIDSKTRVFRNEGHILNKLSAKIQSALES